MPNPFLGAQLYVDPASQAMQFCVNNPNDQRTPAIQQIASVAQAFWLDGKQGDVESYVRGVLSAALAQSRLVTFVIYNRPHRDNGGASAGGVTDFSAYQQFIDGIAAGSFGFPVTFVVEPDALDQMDGSTPDQRKEIFKCLKYALDRLSPNGATYLDMGHPHWKQPDELVPLYRQIGSAANRGFSINVSNFCADSSLASFANSLYRLTGKTVVTDTSRNGNGAPPDPGNWCNPLGRRIGLKPLNGPTSAIIDANLWIKRPGESDGNKPPDCDVSTPGAGDFSADLAYHLVIGH